MAWARLPWVSGAQHPSNHAEPLIPGVDSAWPRCTAMWYKSLHFQWKEPPQWFWKEGKMTSPYKQDCFATTTEHIFKIHIGFVSQGL